MHAKNPPPAKAQKIPGTSRQPLYDLRFRARLVDNPQEWEALAGGK